MVGGLWVVCMGIAFFSVKSYKWCLFAFDGQIACPETDYAKFPRH